MTEADLEYVTARVSSFGEDNRAGITRTLHRISAIRNRKGKIVGLTCRVGRAVYGTIKIIQDLVESGKSVLLLGRPGVGKTTMLREVARVLADDFKKRVIIVDTSNEIAGDGDIPHPGIGHARRMQVKTPLAQHDVMIEAVENHMPQTIVIDEIGTELEALAARTIAERGVQLIVTAHGNTLENLMLNPTLSDLIGGIQSVTLGDEEAKRRGTQKSILERKAPPTFDIIVEIQGWDKVSLHPDVASAIDAILRGSPQPKELRTRTEDGEIHIEQEREAAVPENGRKPRSAAPAVRERPELPQGSAYRIYVFGVDRGRVEQMAKDLHVNARVVENLSEANLFITAKSYYRKKPQKIKDAEAANLPIYVLKSNTPIQIRQMLGTLFPNSRAVLEQSREEPPSLKNAMHEAEEAIEQIKGGQNTVELSPQSNYIRRLQHVLAERNNLGSESTGREPNRRVRIYKANVETD